MGEGIGQWGKTYSVDEVELPVGALKGLEGDGVGVDVEGEGGLDATLDDEKTLGAELVGEDLDGVANEETGPGHVVHDVEDPDEDDHGVVGSGGVLLLVEGGGEGPEDEGAEHTTGGGEEDGATAKLVDEKGGGDGDQESHGGGAGSELEGCVSQTFL